MSDFASEFVWRIRNYRERGSEARARMAEARAREAETMSSLLDKMEVFQAMDTSMLHVSTNFIESISDLPDPEDDRLSVSAVKRENGVGHLVSQYLGPSSAETCTLWLGHHGGKPVWSMDTAIQYFDGSDHVESECFEEADAAFNAFTSYVAHIALRAITGRYEDSGLPLEALHNANVMRGLISGAVDEKRRENADKAVRKDRAARSSVAVRQAWDMVSKDIRFLTELGYSFDGDSEPGRDRIETQPTALGVSITVHSGECWSKIEAQTSADHPDRVLIDISDYMGRRVSGGLLPVGDMDTLVQRLKNLVLDEIEEAEAMWVPTFAEDLTETRDTAPAI